MKKLSEKEKDEILHKLLMSNLYIDEYKKFKKRTHRDVFESFIIAKFFDMAEEFLWEEDGWQIISDYLGNIDIWDSKHCDIVDTLYMTDEGYDEPTDFILALIEFIEENLKEPIILPPYWINTSDKLPENPKNLDWITNLVIWAIRDGKGDCFLNISYNFKEGQWYNSDLNLFEKDKYKVTHWTTEENLMKMIEPK